MTVIPAPLPDVKDTPPPGRRFGRAAKESTDPGGGQGSATLPVKAILVIVCLVWLIPVVGTLITSFRPAEDANSSGWWTIFKSPASLTKLTLANYHDALSGHGMGDAFVNSLAITLPATFIPIMIAAFAAYAFTFMKFPFRDTLFVLIISLLIVPNQVAFVPLLKLYGSLHLTGTFAAAWLAHAGFGMSLAIYILRNYMSTLPKEIIESAKVDGASHFTTFWRLIVPMSIPALASFAIFQFLWVWNDFLVALVFVGSGDSQPLTIALSQLVGQQGQGWQLITAGGFFTMIVPLAVFLSLQRFFIRGLTAGSVKG